MLSRLLTVKRVTPWSSVGSGVDGDEQFDVVGLLDGLVREEFQQDPPLLGEEGARVLLARDQEQRVAADVGEVGVGGGAGGSARGRAVRGRARRAWGGVGVREGRGGGRGGRPRRGEGAGARGPAGSPRR